MHHCPHCGHWCDCDEMENPPPDCSHDCGLSLDDETEDDDD